MTGARVVVEQIVGAMTPFDEAEARDIAFAREWLASTSDIYRRQKHDVPSPHLVVYFLPLRPGTDQALLVDHLDAQAWLPPGGHVEPDEHPSATVERECEEELGSAPTRRSGPLFLTARTVCGLSTPHVDVSLWYTVEMPGDALPCFDPREHAGARWWTMPEILEAKPCTAEPNLARFVGKLAAFRNCGVPSTI